jgi:chaperonin GroES
VKFGPLHDRFLVRRLEADERTKGGIILPDTAKEKPQEGGIVTADPGARDESGKLNPLDVKFGDRVPFGQMVGNRGQDRRRRPHHHEGKRNFGVIEAAASAQKKAA